MKARWLPSATMAAASLAACAVSGAALGQVPVEQFYRDKTINLYIGADIGGGYDSYARLLAFHLGKHIPGNPTIVTQNIPGAGGNKAAGYVYAQAPKDGTAIGAIQSGVALQPLLSDRAMPHDPSKFIYLGSATTDYYLCFVRSDAPVTSFKDVFSTEVIVGASSDASSPRDFPTMLNSILGTKLRIVSGYAGTRQVMIAVERGEVHGMCGQAWSSLNVQRPDWIARGFVKVLVQEGTLHHPEMDRMGVPLSVDFAKTEEDREAMELVYSQARFGRPYMLPPGVPPERVAALRRAFLETYQDKDLLAEAANRRFDIDPLSGDDMQSLVAKLYALPPHVIERARLALTGKSVR
jgi:tripartite-type tricarboxylate transporter receptor subunit TctC